MTEVTHTTQKNDAKEVTGYAIKVDGVTVGQASKTDKGKFNFAPVNGAGKALADVKTMRDLKAEVAKTHDPKFVAAGVEALKASKPAKTEAKASKPAKDSTTQAPAAKSEEDVDLD